MFRVFQYNMIISMKIDENNFCITKDEIPVYVFVFFAETLLFVKIF